MSLDHKKFIDNVLIPGGLILASHSFFHFLRKDNKRKMSKDHVSAETKQQRKYLANDSNKLELKRALDSFDPIPLDKYITTNWFREFRHDHKAVITCRMSDSKMIDESGAVLHDFCSHDFLCLSKDGDIINRLEKYMDHYGVGSCGPRGFFGSTDAHYKLEADISRLFDGSGMLYTVLFPTYSCTMMSLMSLIKKNDILLFDAENASEAIIRAVNRHPGKKIPVSLPMWYYESSQKARIPVIASDSIEKPAVECEEMINLSTSNEGVEKEESYPSINFVSGRNNNSTESDSTTKFSDGKGYGVNIAKNSDQVTVASTDYTSNHTKLISKTDRFETPPQQRLQHYVENRCGEIKSAAKRKLPNGNIKKSASHNVWLLFDSINEFTGELNHIPEILHLCEKGCIRTMVSDSLGFGTIGANGRGAIQFFNDLGYDIDVSYLDIYASSLEMAAAGLGGIAIGSKLLVEHQRNIGVGYVFSAAAPPALCESSRLSIRKFSDSQLRQRINSVVAAGNASFSNFTCHSKPIIKYEDHPIPVWGVCCKDWLLNKNYFDISATDDEIEDYLASIAKVLKADGFLVSAVTAKYGIKITANANTSVLDIQTLASKLESLLKSTALQRKLKANYQSSNEIIPS